MLLAQQTVRSFPRGSSIDKWTESNGLDSQVQLLVQLLRANLAQRGISQPVGYTRENGVRIVDALGGELVLPPSIMRQYSVTSAAISQVC